MAFNTNPAKSRSKIIPFVIAIAVGIGLVIAVRSFIGGDGDPSPSADSSLHTPRKGCTSITVMASSEKAALLSGMADDYNAEDRKVDGKCVDVRVFSKASGGAATALASDWNTAEGPKPDVWSPAGSSWKVLLQQNLTAKDRPNIVPDTVQSIAQTPLVIAMPKPMAQALGWPDKPLGRSDVLALTKNPQGWGAFGHKEWGAFKLGKTNPHLSTSGLNATVAAYFAATGLSSDLTESNLSDPKVQEFVKGVESGVVHYGDTTLTFLENLYAAAAKGQGLTYISAVTVEEKSVWDYNTGNPSGDPKTKGKQAPPKIPLVAIYPKDGTLLSDNPYIILDQDNVAKEKVNGANDFLKFLKAAKQQDAFKAAAFRGYDGSAGPLLKESNGLLPKVKVSVIDPPAPEVLNSVLKSWDTLRKRARVLLVLDTSGSMGNPAGGTGSSKLDLAKDAAVKVPGLMAKDDELGLWTFSTPINNDPQPYREVVPIGPVSSITSEFKSSVDDLQPDGGTALYATAKAAVKAVQEGFDPTKINAVVFLTDGKNEYSADTNVDGLISQLQSEDTSKSVRLFTIGYGEQADQSVLETIAKASSAAAYDASDPTSIDKVLTNVISNF